MKVLVIIKLAFVMLVGVAAAQTLRAKDLKDCEQVQGDPNRAIQACGRVIQVFDDKNVNSKDSAEALPARSSIAAKCMQPSETLSGRSKTLTRS